MVDISRLFTSIIRFDDLCITRSLDPKMMGELNVQKRHDARYLKNEELFKKFYNFK